MRPRLRPFLNSIIVAGLVIAVWPLGQTVYGLWNQRSLAAQFQASQGAKVRQQTPPQARARNTIQRSRAREDSPTLVASTLSAPHRRRVSWPLTKLSIPDIGLETFIVQGMDAPALRRGPGHDVNSSLPGEGNCVVAGHRNVYGSFFYRLDELLPGALITLENRQGQWNYTVEATFSTPDTDLTILRPPPPGAAPILTLITCTMPHTSNRIILRARLNLQ